MRFAALLLPLLWILHELPTAHSSAKELARLPLAVTENYDPNREEARGFAAFTSSFGLATFGTIYQLTALNVESDIREKLEMPELRRYFPDAGERASIARKIADRVNNEYLRGGLTNERVIGATRYAAAELVGTIIRRAMEVEGVKEGKRRALWADRILAPFHSCMAASRTYREGNRCLESLQTDLVKNLGLAIGYEMARQETGPEFTKSLAPAYLACLQLKKPGADSRVQPCVVNGMRTSVGAYAVEQVRKVAQAQAPSAAERVVNRVRTEFTRCLSQASDRAGFNACADSLVARAGAEIAGEAVLLNEVVRAQFPEGGDRKKLAAAANSTFLSCMAEVKKKNLREKSGTLDTSPCVHRVRMETARSVAGALFASNLKKLGITPAAQASIGDEVNEKLESCWDSAAPEKENNACMKESIGLLVSSVAMAKLSTDLPSGLQQQEPALRDRLVSRIRECVNRDLPENMMDAPDAAKKVENCGAALTREAALRVAAYSLRDVLKGKTSDESAPERLVGQLVEKDFAQCLGKQPGEKTLARCSIALKRAAGMEVARLLFWEEFDKALGGEKEFAAYGTSKKERDDFLLRLLGEHGLCLQGNLKEAEPDKADAAMDGCFKRSIRSFSRKVADLVFRKRLKENSVSGAAADRITGEFLADFDACLEKKREPAYTVNQYVEQIPACSLTLTHPYTLKIGKLQIASAVESNLPARTENEERRRAAIRETLTASLSSCMEKVKPEDSAGRDACVDTLKREAVLLIARESARAEAREILQGGEPPKEMDSLERRLEECVKEKDPEGCARSHAKETAKLLASLKLRHTLGDALGERVFRESLPAIERMEGNFGLCVEKLRGRIVDSAFLVGVRRCGSELEEAGIALVQEKLQAWMDRPSLSPAQREIGQEMAILLPCLDGLFPSGPVQDSAMQRLDPEGLLQSVARLAGDYISFDAENAGRDFQKVLAQLEKDLAAAGPEEARRRLLDLLVKEGMIDRLLKSMIRTEVETVLNSLPTEERMGPEVVQLLLAKETLDRALSPEVMERLRPLVSEQLLKPLLLEGRSMKDPAQKAAVRLVEKQVANALLDSPQFGQKLLVATLQKQIDAQTKGTVSRWLFQKFGTSYEWAQIRGTPRAEATERFVMEQLIRPRVNGATLSEKEWARRKAEAGRLVTEAVKNQ